MARTEFRKIGGRVVIVLATLVFLAFAYHRYRQLEQANFPLNQLGLESYHDVTGQLSWLDLDPKLDPVKAQAGKAYLKAWTAWNLALLGDHEQKLERHFSGPAWEKIRLGLRAQVGTVVQTDGEHELSEIFLSENKAVLEFTDRVPVRRRLLRDGKDTGFEDLQVEVYRVLLLQQDGLWRVEQWERTEK